MWRSQHNETEQESDLRTTRKEEDDDMTLRRKEREEIEQEGVPYSIACILNSWEDVTIDNIEMVTNIWEQYKGVDYIIRDDEGTTEINIDTKYHRAKMWKQTLTDYGVDILSIEICKAKGKVGWGIDQDLKTDFIIDIMNNVGYYVIDAHKLHSYMSEHYTDYPIIYNSKGCEDYRGVSVTDLIDNDIIVYYALWGDIVTIADTFITGSDVSYNNYIAPLLDKLITGKS